MGPVTDGWRGRSGTDRAGLAGRVAASAVFRWACFAAMLWLGLHAEARPAARPPDLLLEHVPYVPWVNDWNYYLWLVAWVPLSLWLLARAPVRFSRFMVTGGILSLLRGGCVLLTGLGPVRGEDVNLVRLADPELFRRAFLELIDPLGVFFRHSAHLYLTKDMFFSGHAATTLLLVLYLWPFRWARRVAILLHVLVVASLFLGHIHYSIDVVGALAITFTVFVLREADLRRVLRGPGAPVSP